ncbi:hypothetical protein KRX56_06240 [Dermabacteraceae bacterium TAE3-ERU27]|nr:hypothetical protein [Dermabacteraceae bacterium TAE3-ERU27]
MRKQAMNMMEAMTAALEWADEVGFAPYYVTIFAHPGHFSVDFSTRPELCTGEGLKRILNDGYSHEGSSRVTYKATRKGVACEVHTDRPSSE